MDHIVLFDAFPEKSHLRRAHFDTHLDFLKKNSANIRSAGPLLSHTGTGEAMGGLWIVRGLTDSEVSERVEMDPLFATGLRRTWRVHPWIRVFDDGASTGIRP